MQKFLLITGSSLFLGLFFAPLTYGQTPLDMLIDLRFSMPPDREPGIPDGDSSRSRDGGSRGDCDPVVGLADSQITALIPQEDSEELIGGIAVPGPSQAWGQTTLDHPTFWFEVTNVPTNASFAFRLSQNGQSLYDTGDRPVPLQTGTFPVVIPSTIVALRPEQSYYWAASLKMDCSAEERDVLSADGWVQRVMPSDGFISELETATPAAAVVLYAQEGLWFDALNGVATLYLDHPDNAAVQAGWTSLLESIGLPETMPPKLERRDR